MSSWESWIVDIEGSLKKQAAVLEKEVLYPVPSCLKNEQSELFYHPKEISFGPRHFKLDDRSENFIVSENFKSEAARRFNEDLKEQGVRSLVENLKNKYMERLEKIYGIEVLNRFPPEDRPDGFSWMLVRDGCFVLIVLASFVDRPNPLVFEHLMRQKHFRLLKNIVKDEPENGEKTVLQHILKRDNHHPLLNDIVKNMFKLENQLPLWVLEEIMERLEEIGEGQKETQERPKEIMDEEIKGEHKEFREEESKEEETGERQREIRAELERPKGDWFEYALKNLSPVEIGGKVGRRTYKNRIHILQLLGEYMVDNISPNTHHGEENNEKQLGCPSTILRGLVFILKVRDFLDKFRYVILRGIFAVLLFLLFSPVLILWFLLSVLWAMWILYQIYMGRREEDDGHIPTIEELHGIGVKFRKLEGRGISHIKFDGNKLTLYLPKFTVDDRSEVLLRNLLVMETQWEDTEKIITRYVVFMNDLINTSMDVARLRRQGIIANKLGSDDDVARLWNSVTIPSTDIPRYEQIDTASKYINAYRKKWWRILWAQFCSVHCSKPWLVASLLGGIFLLSLTLVQVVCLFPNCQISR